MTPKESGKKVPINGGRLVKNVTPTEDGELAIKFEDGWTLYLTAWPGEEMVVRWEKSS